MTDDPIVVYGGSFDPCHLGHLAIIKTLTEAEMGRVLVMPSYKAASYQDPAYPKDTVRPFPKKHHFSYDVRCKLLELSLADSRLSHVSISHLEKDLGGESITTRTICHINARPLWWAMGQDQLRHFDQWHNAHNLFFEMNFCVFCRHPVTTDSPKLIDDVRSLLVRLGNYEDAGGREYTTCVDNHSSHDLCQITESYGTKKIRSTQVMLMNFVPPDISSTQIRKQLRTHQTVSSHQISPPAYQYLVEQHLI